MYLLCEPQILLRILLGATLQGVKVFSQYTLQHAEAKITLDIVMHVKDPSDNKLVALFVLEVDGTMHLPLANNKDTCQILTSAKYCEQQNVALIFSRSRHASTAGSYERSCLDDGACIKVWSAVCVGGA